MTPSSTRQPDSTEPSSSLATQSAGPLQTSRSVALAIALLPAVAIAIVYARVRNFSIAWDDGLLSFARVYRDCDLEAIFTTPANTFEYLPVRDLTLCVDHALWGDWAGGFHLHNVLIFMITCALLSGLLNKIFLASRNEGIAKHAPLLSSIATLAFAMHPLQVEPVAFITARNALLALLFLIGTLCAVERHIATGRTAWYVASILATTLALFSKATSLPAAVIAALLCAYLARERPWKRVALYAAPHLTVTAIATLLHTTIASSQGAMGGALSLAEVARRLPRAAFVPQFYLYKFVWPASLSSDYVLDDVRANIVWFGVGAVILTACMGWLLWRGVRERTTSAFFAASFIAALVPVSNILPTHPPVADRYVQIPLAFLVPLAITLVAPRIPTRARLGVSTIWIVALAVLSVRQLPVWENDEKLFAHAAAVDERAVQSIENLAHTQWMLGKEVEAIETFARYAAQKPNDGRYELFQAWHAVRQGDLETADALLDRASSKAVVGYLVHIVRAEIATARGQKRVAVRAYERALIDAERRFQRHARARVYLRVIKKRLRRLERR
ncbi:MAG: hypothetical protein QF570_17215 [Myxococcota bacterium]|jgi:hypothetical protein|nr:hypothetical protein [Myxococcota bacterium]